MRLRRQRQRDDRRVGRVHLRIERRIGQVARQRRGGRIDRRLHILRGAVDVAVEVELQRDLADAEGARRRHRLQRRDLAELPLKRSGHQRGDGVGIGARQLRRHLDGREIDLRQRRDRQPPVAETAAQHHRDAEQRGRDRPVNEWRRDAHCCVFGLAVPPPRCRRAAALPLRALTGGLSCRCFAAADRDLGAVGEAGKAGGHDALGRLKTLADHRLRLVLFLHRNRPHRDGIVVLDDVHEGAVRTALHRAGRDHHDLLQRVDQQPHIDELPGPELQVGVGKFGLELHRAGGLVDLIVDDPEHAAVDHRVVVRALRFDRRADLCRRRSLTWERSCCGRVEQHRDRLQLRDDNNC